MKNKTIIEGTATTLRFELDSQNGIISLKGRSIPTDPSIFFEPILRHIDKYLENPSKKTTMTIMVDYFNTPSDKYLLDILRKLEAVHSFGKDISVIWHYEEGDEDMEKAGEYYKSILKIPLRLEEIKED